MGYYPIFLDVSRGCCVVIGGGVVARRRVAGLLAAGARVTVVSPVITEELAQLVLAGAVEYVARAYEPGDLAGYKLAFVATDDGDVNQAIFSEARSRGVLVNCADDPARCDFILPAVIRRGELSVAVSTGGASPATTRAIREELDDYLTADYVPLVQIAAAVRQELKGERRTAKPEVWNRALKGEFRRLVSQGMRAQAKALLRKTLGVDP
jgi:siroheme synthase-like protein